MKQQERRILIAGGGTFLGNHIAAALLAEGAEPLLLVRPGGEENLGFLVNQVEWRTANVWDAASLRGQARGYHVVINTVGSMLTDPRQGLTHHRLNFVSARNIAAMCVSDGVANMILMSATRAPWVSRSYIRSKREAEQYLGRVGVRGAIVRAPLLYERRKPRPTFYELLSLIAAVPPLSLFLRNMRPMPVDILARGVARLATQADIVKPIYFASDLRRLNSREEATHGFSRPPMQAPVFQRHSVDPFASDPEVDTDPIRTPPKRFNFRDEDAAFGWNPPTDADR